MPGCGFALFVCFAFDAMPSGYVVSRPPDKRGTLIVAERCPLTWGNPSLR